MTGAASGAGNAYPSKKLSNHTDVYSIVWFKHIEKNKLVYRFVY